MIDFPKQIYNISINNSTWLIVINNANARLLDHYEEISCAAVLVFESIWGLGQTDVYPSNKINQKIYFDLLYTKYLLNEWN